MKTIIEKSFQHYTVDNQKNSNLINIVEKLKANRIIKKDIEISENTGFSKSVVSNYLSGRVEASKNFIEAFQNFYKVSVNENFVFENKFFKRIPFYNINVSAGDIVFLDNGLIDGVEPDDYMFIPKNIDADIAFPTFGHSMYPEISNGDWVAYKFLRDWSFFNYGMKYLIVTVEQRMVKYIKKHNKEGYLLLESRNEDYEPIDMPLNSIKQILQVRYIGKIEM